MKTCSWSANSSCWFIHERGERVTGSVSDSAFNLSSAPAQARERSKQLCFMLRSLEPHMHMEMRCWSLILRKIFQRSEAARSTPTRTPTIPAPTQGAITPTHLGQEPAQVFACWGVSAKHCAFRKTENSNNSKHSTIEHFLNTGRNVRSRQQILRALRHKQALNLNCSSTKSCLNLTTTNQIKPNNLNDRWDKHK